MTDAEKRATFEEMLRKLERDGNCLYKYHDLAWELFGERME